MADCFCVPSQERRTRQPEYRAGLRMASGAIPPSSHDAAHPKGSWLPRCTRCGLWSQQPLSRSSCDSGHWSKLRVSDPSHVSGANTLSTRLYVRPRLVEYSRLLCQCGLEDREMAGAEMEYNSLITSSMIDTLHSGKARLAPALGTEGL